MCVIVFHFGNTCAMPTATVNIQERKIVMNEKMVMGRACCVLGCTSGGDVPSHQIPKNPVLFNKWKSMIYSEKIQHLTDEQISKCAVCYRHFTNDDYLVTFKVRKLKRGVTPSQNLPNKPVTDNDKSKIFMEEVELQTEDANIDISIEKTCRRKNKETEVSETTEIFLFEDLPEKVEFNLPEYSQQILLSTVTINTKQEQAIDSITKVSESNCRVKVIKRRKRVKLTANKLALLQCKMQAEQYARTPTIQKLLSHLTSAERESIQTKIRKSKYAPKVYVRIYHDIAKRMALGQLCEI